MHLRPRYLLSLAALVLCLEGRAQMGNLSGGGSFIEEYTNFLTVDAPWRLSGDVLIVGEGSEIRAMLPYGGSVDGGKAFAEIVNRCAELFPEVRVYCMPIPTACEFYTPYLAESTIRSQAAVISSLFSFLSPAVQPVDVYSTLGRHAAEPVFARTDHRWLPLGAYYAAEAFAETADVPFRELDGYQEKEVSGFSGTLSRYTKDQALLDAPERFTRYLRKDNEGLHPSGRRLLIIKDGSGKMLTEFLQFSFEEIRLADCRRFRGEMGRIIRTGGITDIVFAIDLEHIGMPAVLSSLRSYLDR